MIIRRRHTANFTTIGNALFDDERLAIDAVGLLAYLLSRPHDWEVRRPALMRRWKIGSVSMRRIMNSLLQAGWVAAKKTRLSDGTFRIIYEVRDEPGPELSEDDVRKALAPESGAVVAEESDETTTGSDSKAQPGPPLCQPYVDDQGVVTGGVAYKTLPNTDYQGLNPHQRGGRAFADVKTLWPVEHVLSFIVCETIHAGLIGVDQDAAFRGIKPYLTDCQEKNRKICDLATYYRERRWERFAQTGMLERPKGIKVYSAQWHRWREYRIATGQSIKYMESYAREHPDGIWSIEPSEWPPPLPRIPPLPIDPPDAIAEMSEEDVAAFR